MREVNSVAERVILEAAEAFHCIDSGHCGLDDYLDFRLKFPQLRSRVGSLLFVCFRRRRQLEKTLAAMVARMPPEPVRHLLLVAMGEMLFQDGIAPESSANVAVEIAKRKFNRSTGNFINAVLRRLLRERPAFPDEIDEVLPPEILRVWRRRFSEAQLHELTRIFLSKAPFTFRASGGFEPPPEFDAVPVECSAPFRCFRTERPAEVIASEALRRGEIYIQDPAATLAVSLADFSNVKRALDLCAAPGGKSLMIAERLNPGATLIAADRSARRQELTRENFRRRGLDFPVIVAEPESIEGEFDLVLADVPCSNTGVFRRRPDALWRFNRAMLTEVVALQEKILHSASERTAPGGQLLYSTCSIEPQENRQQLERFLADHPAFECRVSRQLLPDQEHDGAYAALLVRKAQSI